METRERMTTYCREIWSKCLN